MRARPFGQRANQRSDVIITVVERLAVRPWERLQGAGISAGAAPGCLHGAIVNRCQRLLRLLRLCRRTRRGGTRPGGAPPHFRQKVDERIWIISSTGWVQQR
jgi:hypothetical protein